MTESAVGMTAYCHPELDSGSIVIRCRNKFGMTKSVGGMTILRVMSSPLARKPARNISKQGGKFRFDH